MSTSPRHQVQVSSMALMIPDRRGKYHQCCRQLYGDLFFEYFHFGKAGVWYKHSERDRFVDTRVSVLSLAVMNR